MIPVPLPGGGTFSLGVAGGPLVMALVLGWLGRTGPIGWGMPVVANLVLRNLGLAVFIGSVAIGAGSPFVQTVATNGIQILLGGAAVLLTLVLIVLGGGLPAPYPVRRPARCLCRVDRQSGHLRRGKSSGAHGSD